MIGYVSVQIYLLVYSFIYWFVYLLLLLFISLQTEDGHIWIWPNSWQQPALLLELWWHRFCRHVNNLKIIIFKYSILLLQNYFPYILIFIIIIAVEFFDAHYLIHLKITFNIQQNNTNKIKNTKMITSPQNTHFLQSSLNIILILRWSNLLRDDGRAVWECAPCSLQQLGLIVCAAALNCDPGQRGAGDDLLSRTVLHEDHHQPSGALVVSQQQGQAGEKLFWPALWTILPHRAAHHHHTVE